MNKAFFLTIFLLSTFTFSIAKAQSALPDELSKKWDNVIEAIQRRNDIAESIAGFLSKTDYNEKDLLKQCIAKAAAYRKALKDNKLKNATEIEKIRVFYQEQSIQLNRILVLLEKYPDIRKNKKQMELTENLEGAENRVVVATADFNTSCNKLRRKDLIFEPHKNETPPEVAF
ncbi:MAG: LemA family protein [Chitinophagaceae bacterium]|nr:LemA family protein [Chitinophagaceae bacterium]